MKIVWGIVMTGSLFSGCTFVERHACVDRSVAGVQEISDTQESSAKEERTQLSGMSAFKDGVSNSYHPVRGERFRNTGREILQVIQVLSDKGRDGDGLKYVLAVDYSDYARGMVFWVESSRDYVDGELIAEGVYEFVGTQNYETCDKSRKTVRVFRELTDLKSK